MRLENARDTILDYFLPLWGSTTTIALDNQIFEPPIPSTAWIRLSIQFYDGEQASLGSNDGKVRYRHYGMLFIQVFTPVGEGTYNNDVYCQKLKDLFDSKDLNGITFYDVHVKTIGRTRMEDDGGIWYQQQVIADIQFDEDK